MTPADLDALDPADFEAMVRYMGKEAQAMKRAQRRRRRR